MLKFPAFVLFNKSSHSKITLGFAIFMIPYISKPYYDSFSFGEKKF